MRDFLRGLFMDEKKKKKDEKKKDQNGNGNDTEKHLTEHPPYPDLRPKKLNEPIDQPDVPE